MTERESAMIVPKISAFIFDLDGVLVDTAKYHFSGWQKLGEQLGINLDEKDNDKLKGVGRIESLQYILDKGGLTRSEKEMEELAARKNGWYLDAVNGMSPDEILPGVIPFLEQARQLGIALAVGSGSKNATFVLDKIGIASLFTVITDGSMTSQSKPHPEVFSSTCISLGLHPSECVVFEDAPSGIEAAHSAGCYAVGIGSKEVLGAAELCVPGFEDVTPTAIIQQLLQGEFSKQ